MTDFSRVEQALEKIREGGMVVVVDDEDRENEGDLIMAAEKVTPAAVNFFAVHGRGLICAPADRELLHRLDLDPMEHQHSRAIRTPFTISVDASEGVTTGISAVDRARTVSLIAGARTRPEDLARPGHVFPLAARPGGVLQRAGHTEAAVDLARLAGLRPAGMLCEILNDDGSMARVPDLEIFCERHGLLMISVRDLIRYRYSREKLVARLIDVDMPTEHGHFRLFLYESRVDGMQHAALVKGEPANHPAPLVRVHSKCFTGDTLGSHRCDCGQQRDLAMRLIEEDGNGVFLYMNQEGRGIGLENKLRAYKLQEEGLDTVEANHRLGFRADLRDYGIGAQILADLGLRRLRLLTNNPRKIVGLEAYGLEVVERLPLEVEPNPDNVRYLHTKREKLGHLLEQA
ncbi:MAG: bifunctional 3,4-dihydroxy-2-butanone-4-phosphate synthase/GTP cyclohydrolase II [Candidatus Krumholzibacteriota bacterium]|nr:bifunctional 3,4-dihydroxy-2-butanone-4-phosphate synthase/GTP cyclohydrolase II [Candidatus Krumholzibacteriota bacterium]